MSIPRSAREKLFETAARLFYKRGYRATGVDTIASESGIGKMTLYRHFPSKGRLIVDFLRQSDQDFWRYFEQNTKGASGAREKLLAFFRALQGYVTSSACYGCPFINAATEYPETKDEGHRVALEHKRTVRTRFRQLAEQAGARQPQALADGLVLLMDGAYTAARTYGASPDSPAAGVAEAAQRMIEASCRASKSGRRG